MDIRDFFHLSHEGQNWTGAFALAAETLKREGGGVLTVPAGEYPTGSVRLYSDTTLEIQAGATLRFIQNEEAFPLIDLEFEGASGKVRRPCIYAENARNIALTGYGTLDGQGEYWWKMNREKTLTYPRPYLVCFSGCEHVTLENLTLVNSPCWTVHPLRCRNVVIRGLNIHNPADSPNTDGINPDACSNVRIHDCTIDVGDDCIAIKSGTEITPMRAPCERIVISNCHFLHGHGGIVIGSEMSGDIRDVLVSDCVFYETDRGVRLKTRRARGGVVENLRLCNLVMDKVMCPFVLNMYYFCGNDGRMRRVWDKAAYPVDEGTPAFRNISITGVIARHCSACAGYVYGLREMPAERLSLRDVTVEMAENGAPGHPAMMDDCPAMQAEGFFIRNARHVEMSNVRVIGARGETMNADESVGFD